MRAWGRLGVFLLLVGLPFGVACQKGGGREEDAAAKYFRVLDSAWGPETPQNLEKFLAVREGLLPIYQSHANWINELALRHAGGGALNADGMLGLVLMSKEMEQQLTKQGLTDEEFSRMTMLVYGRWLRASSSAPLVETKALRSLQEQQEVIKRRLANNPPTDPQEMKALKRRLDGINYQIPFMAVWGLMDKKATLARIDPATAKWLTEHRSEIERLSFGDLDTAGPTPPGEEKKPAAPPKAG